MNRRWIGFAVWLLLTVCLYFFENNAGTRIVMLCTMLIPLIPLCRQAFFSRDEAGGGISRPPAVRVSGRREMEESGNVRAYAPGDPVGRIHWKLSVRKDELLIRETDGYGAAEEETAEAPAEDGQGIKAERRLVAGLVSGMLLCAALLLLIPEANRGAQALCNRIFAESEKANAYIYDYFPVPEGQSCILAACLAGGALSALAAVAAAVRSGPLILSVMAACTLFQVCFGLPFPAWVNVPLYGLLSLRMMKRPWRRGSLLAYGAAVLLVSLLVLILFPGADAATEAASEAVRDRLSLMAQSVMDTVSETREGETETRHVHTRSLSAGEDEAGTDRVFRLVTVEEEQVSMPHWVNWLKAILPALLGIALMILPFAPFLLLNARKRKAQESRKAFLSGNVDEAVCAIFRAVISWLDETGHGRGNLLYRDWADQLPDLFPDGYAARFARCAEDFEEAAYSGHPMREDMRRRALELLRETETALWKKADWKQRFRLKYWKCLYE